MPAIPSRSSTPPPGQPRPVLEAADHEAKSLLSGDAAAAGAVVGLLSYFGLGSATANFVLALLGLIPGAITYATTLFAQAQAAYRVWQNAEDKVTPTSAPRAADGTPLVPDTAAVTQNIHTTR